MHKSDRTKVFSLSKFLEIDIPNKSTPLLPLLFVLQTVLIKSQLMSTKYKIPVSANFFQYTKKYQKNFWTKQT